MPVLCKHRSVENMALNKEVQ